MKSKIDENILKIDIYTLQNNIEKTISEGKRIKSDISQMNLQIEEIGDIEFSINTYESMLNEKSEKLSRKNVLEEKYKYTKKMIKDLT